MKSAPLIHMYIHIYIQIEVHLCIHIYMLCNQTSQPPFHRSPLRVGNNLDIFHDNKKFHLFPDANPLQTLLTISGYSKPFWYLKYILVLKVHSSHCKLSSNMQMFTFMETEVSAFSFFLSCSRNDRILMWFLIALINISSFILSPWPEIL